MNNDHYTILGVDRNATVTEIKKAFRKKALQLHPDQGGDEQAFRELKAAFEYLITHPLVEDAEIGYNPGGYDPFTDANYDKHTFFAPEHDHIAEFERTVRAQGCPYCHGIGTISKLVDPSQGFMGRQERFCRCQIVQWAPA
ncbi:MAG TPA: J domain-containing protein [Verrucomicrobiae bacterium]|nr:J domain-containing protein [Verrucomicrobiae bacterium]